MMDAVELIEVIKTTLTRRGNGKDDPIRIITQYWSKDGVLLVEVDPLNVPKISDLGRAPASGKPFCFDISGAGNLGAGIDNH